MSSPVPSSSLTMVDNNDDNNTSAPSLLATTTPQPQCSDAHNNNNNSSSSDSSDLSSSTKAVSSASALVGEAILDNPRRYSNATTSKNSNAKMQQLVLLQQQQQQQQQSTSSRTQRAKEWVSSSVSSGVAWWHERKQRRQREELERQVEEQRKILLQTQQQQQKNQQQQNTTTTLQDNVTFQNLMRKQDNVNSIATSTQGPTNNTAAADKDHKVTPLLASVVHPSHSGDGLSVDVVLPPSPASQKKDNNNINNTTTNNITAHEVTTDDDDDEDWIPPVRIEPESSSTLESSPHLLTREEMQQLAVHALPAGISSYARWKRIYSLSRDGDSFDTFLRNCSGHQHTLLIIKTSRNALLGGYADSCWGEASSCSSRRGRIGGVGNHGFYGGAQACLFHIRPPPLTVYPWSGANRYIQLCNVEKKLIAMGGGGQEGAFGLCVECDFQKGSTGRCDTFRNAPLCQPSHFDVVDVEVYGFLIGQF